MKYKNKDGIKLSIGKMGEVGKIGSAMDLVQEVVSEAVRMCDNCNRWNINSVHFTIDNVKNFLIENFDLEDDNGR